MGIAVFFLLALIAAAIIVYPLLPGRGVIAQPIPAVTDADIEQAVRHLRRAQGASGSDRFCPACGQACQTGDRFCVRCGGALPQLQATLSGVACPSCGSALREGDLFCAKCGQRLAAEEAPL